MADEKLIFPIGFDLEEGVAKVEKDWGKMQKRLQDTFKSQTIQVDADISKAVLDKLYAKFEGLIKTMESKAPQIKLKMPDTVDFEQEINRLKVQLKSINLGELTDAESKDLYLYIRQLEALAKALKEVNKQEQLRQANNPANKALQEARAQEKLTRAKANDALAEQRRAKIATETARQNEINNRSAQRGAVIAEQKRAATARAEQAELRLTQAKERSTAATERQNSAYKTQGSYLQRLTQRMIAYASITQAFSFVRNVRDVTAEFELQRVALGSIIGDLNEANAMFEQIKAAAVKSPFQIKELVTYTKQLAAYKIESDELFETTQRLADISAGLGVGMERLVLAYGQIRATGYLRASEVRQLTEAGIPIVEELAKKMSELRGETVSAAEVMGMISERAISFGMVKEVFDDMTSAGGMFYKMQEKQAETLAGQWSNLQDAISIMYEEIGNTEGVNNSIKGTIGLVKSLAENWQSIANLIKYTAIQYGVMYGATLFIPKLLRSTELMAKSQDAFAKASKISATATQRHSAILAFSAKQTRLYAYWMRKAATAHTMFGRGLKQIMAMLAGGGWIGVVIGLLTAMTSLIISAVKESKRLNNELSKIGTEGAMQAEQSVRNFEYLAKTIRESADGSEKQTAALAELKRSYGELLPSQDKEIKALVQEKSNYDALIESIREKINLQIHEQKLNAIAGEYGGRISKQESKLQKTLSEIGLSPAEIGRIFETVKQKVQEGATLGIEDFAKILTDKTTLAFERVGGTSVVTAGLFKGVDVRDFEKYVETLGEYNEQIELVGGSLDHLDDKGKNLSDTFNTWQKELASITEGKNLKGEGIRIFDDESIAQTPKLTSALEKVAEKYKELKKEKAQVDKALASEGAKADKQTYAQLEERLGKINEGMSGLEAFLKKYGGLSLITEKGENKSQLAILQEELQLHEKIYAKYKEYRKYMSAEQAKTKVEDYFGDTIKSLKYTPSFEKSGYQNVLTQYKTAVNALLAKAKNETEKGAIKKVLLELGFKIDDKDWEETKDNMEKNLKKLSDDLSRTKTAKEFFDRMLGLTGDKQLSASLTVSIYGGEMGDDLGERLAKDMATKFQEQVQTYFGDINISSAINKATGEIDPIKLEKLLTEENVEKMGKDNVIEVRKIINDLIKANADYATELFKSYEKFFDYEKRMTMVTQREEAERKKIRESMIPDDQKAQLIEASKKREQEQISAIEIEQLKDTADWEKTFEDLNNLGSLTVKNLISLLEDYIAKKKEAGEPIAESDMKILVNELNQLRERDAQLDPFATIKVSLKDLTDATNEYNEAKENGDEKGMEDAQNKRAKALNKLEAAVNAVASGFQNLSNLLTEFQKLLGIEDDSVMGEVLNGAAKALGFVATALMTVITLTMLWNSTLWANPLFAGVAIVSGVLGAIAGVFSAISNAKVRRANREIERQQKLLDQLAYSYERLEKAQEKAFGSDYISNYEQRMANLQAQQDAYMKQAHAERSKGKKADADKIKEYEEQARATADAIKDMQSELSEYFLGTDLTSAARDFANAWIEAYKEFGSTTDAMKEKFQDMIQNMIVESFAAKVIQTALSDIFTEIDNMTKDGVLDVSEASKIADMTEVAVGNIDVGMTNLMNALSQAGISVRGMGSDLTGISRDIATASEESILGLAAGINTQNFYISQVPTKLDTIIGLLRGENAMQGSAITLQDLVTIQNQFLSHLPTIAQHTADTVAECKQIVAETRRTADALERVIKPRGTQATHTLNATIN